jgi:hypothetical protein
MELVTGIAGVLVFVKSMYELSIMSEYLSEYCLHVYMPS